MYIQYTLFLLAPKPMQKTTQKPPLVKNFSSKAAGMAAKK